MAISAAQLALSSAHTPNISIVESTGSTNADLLAHSGDIQGWPHMSVLITDDQRSGRGRLDRLWEAPAGASIALSVLLRADRIAMSAMGWVPLIAGLAMTASITAQLGHAVAAKWPNDVLVGGKKICGILAEVAPGGQAIVVGCGINTAMTAEQAPVETATSFAMLGTEVHLDLLVSHYLGVLTAELAGLIAAEGDADRSGLRERFTKACSTIGMAVTIHLPDATTFTGVAEGIDHDGRLLVNEAGVVRTVSAGDVVHVR